MIVTSTQLTISLRRDIAVLQKESSALEGEEDVKEGFAPESKLHCASHDRDSLSGTDSIVCRTAIAPRSFAKCEPGSRALAGLA
jgi:hypothetical protein